MANLKILLEYLCNIIQGKFAFILCMDTLLWVQHWDQRFIIFFTRNRIEQSSELYHNSSLYPMKRRSQINQWSRSTRVHAYTLHSFLLKGKIFIIHFLLWLVPIIIICHIMQVLILSFQWWRKRWKCIRKMIWILSCYFN